MLFRAYLLTRLRLLLRLPPTAGGWIVPILLSGALFGAGHAYQGLTGAILTATIGIALGVAYVATSGTLWINIVAHGVFDTLGFLALFFGLDRLMG